MNRGSMRGVKSKLKYRSIAQFAFMSGCALTFSQESGAVASGQTYKLVSACSATGQVMAVANGSLANNALIVLDARNDLKSSQVFKFDSYGAGYKITAMNSGKTLNIAKASTAAHAPLEQYKFTGVNSEIFTVEATSDGYTRLKSVNSGLYVNLAKASIANGTPFEQYLNTTACAEKFKLVSFVMPAPSPTPSPSPSPSVSPKPSPSPTPTGVARDPLKQPFASTSIWNMPIGSGAVFKPANIPANQDNGNVWATWPGVDEELLFLNPGTTPLMPVYFNANAWNGGDRCVASESTPRKSLPIPSNFYLSGNGNYGTVFLQKDQRTLSQFQPFTHCNGYNYATGYMFAPDVDLYGDGIFGTHGGSGLSSIGGSIRMGELRPGQQGPRHALKMNVYAYQILYKCTGGTSCYRWPASWADSYATASNGYGHSPSAVNNSNPDMKMGALLAIPRSVSMASLGLQTEPGKQLFFTLQNYGVYIVDDGAAAGVQISIEKGPSASKVDEFQKDYGYPFAARLHDNTPWVHDMQALITHLQVVSNNSPTSIGGGGTPLQPLAPPIAP